MEKARIRQEVKNVELEDPYRSSEKKSPRHSSDEGSAITIEDHETPNQHNVNNKIAKRQETSELRGPTETRNERAKNQQSRNRWVVEEEPPKRKTTSGRRRSDESRQMRKKDENPIEPTQEIFDDSESQNMEMESEPRPQTPPQSSPWRTPMPIISTRASRKESLQEATTGNFPDDNEDFFQPASVSIYDDPPKQSDTLPTAKSTAKSTLKSTSKSTAKSTSLEAPSLSNRSRKSRRQRKDQSSSRDPSSGQIVPVREVDRKSAGVSADFPFPPIEVKEKGKQKERKQKPKASYCLDLGEDMNVKRKSLRIQESGETENTIKPENDNVVRRSSRHRFTPLRWWMGERVSMQRNEGDECPVVTAVYRAETEAKALAIKQESRTTLKVKEPRQTRVFVNNKKNKNGTKLNNQKDKKKTLTQDVKIEENVLVTDDASGTEQSMIASYTTSELEWRTIVHDVGQYEIALTFVTDQYTACELKLPPQSCKGWDSTSESLFVGSVLNGERSALCVELEGWAGKNILLSQGDHLTIPPDTTYNLKNNSTRNPVHLQLFVCKI
eukprot:GHVP01059914.1.p1 GENE.GHVP01059914.1~~GHVP01059914.1.p1  ORF type:complete len:588 (+),score=128.47 GHVP01059914.1:100-1764(+)